jgi:formylglycine-generating enzyme required for sulfatase activity
VVNVSWHDARAYCQWLAVATGKAYRLPSESEWEKAARGGLRIGGEDNPYPDRIYPWGDRWDEKQCNSIEDGPGHTTPVGQYSPRGDSPYGCVDMAGNVWEWCSSLRKPYPYDPKDGREDAKAAGFRMLRGGSWSGSQGDARVSSRNDIQLGYALGSIGFRVCVAAQ